MNKDGIHAVREAVKELESYGYIIRKRVRKDGRLGGAEYTIVEEPCIKNPHTVKPCTDSPTLADLIYENHRLLSKDKPSIDKSNTEYTKYGLNHRMGKEGMDITHARENFSTGGVDNE